MPDENDQIEIDRRAKGDINDNICKLCKVMTKEQME